MDQKNIENFQKQIEQNTMKTYLNRLQNNDAIFDEVRYPTGFPELDKALSGGLVAGLHCIGAISSLGKTTFVLQMAENMASTGIPVIIFSLEMRPEQLVAKTVSKNMYLAALERVDSQNIDIYHHAKGYSDLMCERNRKAFTAKERILYENSCETMLGLQLKGVGTKDFDVFMARAKNPREVELVLIKGRGIGGEQS